MKKGSALRTNTKLYILPVFLLAILMWSGISAREKVKDEKTMEFRSIWELIKKKSHLQKAAAREEMAAYIQKNRQGRHWFPKIYTDIRGYSTNDPGMNLMSNMGSASVRNEDFNPDKLNNPGFNNYGRGVLGIDLPVYEGGAGVASTRAMKKLAEARKFQRKLIYLNEYSMSAAVYGRVIVAILSKSELKELEISVNRILNNYQGGLRSNPVEYSGILGLMALKNRFRAMIGENDTKIESLQEFLEKMSGTPLPESWFPGDNDIIEFSEKYLNTVVKSGPGGSFNTRAYEALADSAESRAEAEKSVFLPRIGLFTEANIFNSSRDNADSYTAGFYIRMNLLSPTDYGAVKQAKLRSEAAKSMAKDIFLKETIELSRLTRMSATLKKNITILKESQSLMNKQIRNSLGLYSRGSIRSFQIAEILSRKADLLVKMTQAQEEYINVMAGIYRYSVSEDNEVKNDR